MKIDDSFKKTQGTGLPSRAAASSQGAAAGAASSADSVSLSAEARALAASGAADGGFDAGKVEEIKAAIAGGRFRVDADKVAGSLLESVRELIAKGKN